VTGSSGFLGRYLIRVLLQRQARVIALCRDQARAADALASLVASGNVEVRNADLGDRAALTRGLAGGDAVIHAAALVSIGKASRAVLFAANAAGTRNLCHATAACGIRRVILVSSASVYRPRADHCYRVGDAIWDAETAGNRLSWYGISKAAAEKEARFIARELGLALTIARPHQVYGAFDQKSFTRYFRALMRPLVTVWFTHVRLPSVYAGDLAEALVRMLETPQTVGHTYNVAGWPDTSTWWAHYRAWRRAGGPPRLVLPIPFPVRRELDIQPVQRELLWRNRPLDRGFAETMALERGELVDHDPEASGPWPSAPRSQFG
jgi:nucleoside-diphosphate-sugar epimerase